MVNDADRNDGSSDNPPPSTKRRRRTALLILSICVIGAGMWSVRHRAMHKIASAIAASHDLPARFDVIETSPRRIVFANVVVGNPARPDLVARRVEVVLTPALSVTDSITVRVFDPKLRATYHDNRLSFGVLDKILFTESEEPFSIPPLNLVIKGGRGVVYTDYGNVGLSVHGAGNLASDFTGIAALVAPALQLPSCNIDHARIYGRVRIRDEQPSFSGPAELGGLDCGKMGLTLNETRGNITASLGAALDTAKARILVDNKGLVIPGVHARALQANGDVSWHKTSGIKGRYSATASHANLRTFDAGAGEVTLAGKAAATANLAQWTTSGQVHAQQIAARGADLAIEKASRAANGTFAADLLNKLRRAAGLSRSDGRFSADYGVHATGDIAAIALQGAQLTGVRGQPLVSFDKALMVTDTDGIRALDTGFATGGADMPRISGTIQQTGDRGIVARLSMPAYRAANAGLAIPRLEAVRKPDGAVYFTGNAQISGPLYTGFIKQAALPLDGVWQPDKQNLTLWRDCFALKGDQLYLVGILLEQQTIPVCPANNSGIVSMNGGKVHVSARVPQLNLFGHIGGERLHLTSGPAQFAMPGRISARNLSVALGAQDARSFLDVERLDGATGKTISGRFHGATGGLFAVPLDLSDGSGAWAIRDGALILPDFGLQVADREGSARFEPLIAKNASLRFADGKITANAVLRHPATLRKVVDVRLDHDLSRALGHADLDVSDLVFDDKVQPSDLSKLALGVVASVRGSVNGAGRIEWNHDGVTSTGEFTTQSLDLDAAFGPVKGVTGKLVFTDLLNLVSAPDQMLSVGSINPGIEVNDGKVVYSLEPNRIVSVTNGVWPFLGGSLVVEPARVPMVAEQDQRFTLDIKGIDAARLVERLELANIALTGIFDGKLPLVFDQTGGRVECGFLKSRAPGGNVSYVGALTYEALPAVASYAFDALKSLDYQEMTVDLNGSLSGEMVTKIKFADIHQGKDATSNFITRRISKLPLEFRANVRGPFFQLVSSFKSFYDTGWLRDPRELGLVDPDRNPPALKVQHSESMDMQ